MADFRANPGCIGLGGVFVNVLRAGTVGDGDSLRLTRRPHPDLTLRRVSELCYGGEKNRLTCLISEFLGTPAEFERLAACPELAVFEWRARLTQYAEKQQQQQEAAAKEAQRVLEEAKRRATQMEQVKAIAAVVVVLVAVVWILQNK